MIMSTIGYIRSTQCLAFTEHVLWTCEGLASATYNMKAGYPSR